MLQQLLCFMKGFFRVISFNPTCENCSVKRLKKDKNAQNKNKLRKYYFFPVFWLLSSQGSRKQRNANILITLIRKALQWRVRNIDVAKHQ